MSKEMFYNSISDDFSSIMNMYDTDRRINIIFNDFLGKENLKSKLFLDAGCGTGLFTKAAILREANVTAIDISPNLVNLTKKNNPSATVIECSLLHLPFQDNYFDYVISSDVIEHTSDPIAATKELIRVLKKGGKLCITVPNKSFWYFSVKLANFLNFRKYQGFENWVYYGDFKNFLVQNKIDLIDYWGFHTFPFVFSFLNPLLRYIDKVLTNKFDSIKINIASYGTKL